MNRELFALVMEEVPDEYSLAQLGRAIAYAPRRDQMRVERSFVRTRGGGKRVVHDSRDERTQRIRIRPQHAVL